MEEVNYRFEQAGLPKDCSLSRIVSARTCIEYELKATRQRVAHSSWRKPHEPQLERSQQPHKPTQDTEPEEEAVSIDELTFTDELPPPSAETIAGAFAAKAEPDDGDESVTMEKGYGDGGALGGAGLGLGPSAFASTASS